MKRLAEYLERAINFYCRRSSWYRARDLRTMRNNLPCVSFSFDDFPRSAAAVGGKILEEYGLRGSYYASMKTMGEDSPVGRLFFKEDLEYLIEKKHEIGCHTYDHRDAWSTKPPEFRESIIKNAITFTTLFPGHVFNTSSYVISDPHPNNKQIAGASFSCCRGGGQKINTVRIDRKNLKSVFVDYRNRENLKELRKHIDENRAKNGWIIFSTHDIAIRPSQYGCTPKQLEYIVKHSVNSGACILPINEMYSVVTGKE